MAREVQPYLVEPKVKEITGSTADEFDSIVEQIEEKKEEIAKATVEKNDKEKMLIDTFFGTKAKGSITLSGITRKVKVEFENGIKSDLKEAAEKLPKDTFDLVFPAKREFSASAHNAHVKKLEEAALTSAKKKQELEEYLKVYKEHVHYTPNKPSVKIEKIGD